MLTVKERDAEIDLMKNQIGDAAYDALQRLNWHYGVGEPASINITSRTQDGVDGYVTLRITNGSVKRKFSIRGTTLYYRKHQKKF